jgi:2-phospho-L-lactate guanylyltransferase
MRILVPIKGLAGAKTRLKPALSVAERACLCRAMFLDVMAALLAFGSPESISILTDDAELESDALATGYSVQLERGEGLNGALRRCAREMSELGVPALMIVPADIPAITPDDLSKLAGERRESITLAPAIVDGGTNLLICAPPDAIEFHFGPHSAARHIAAARAAGAVLQVVRPPHVIRDIDRPEDLLWLLVNTRTGAAVEYLKSSGIAKRLLNAKTRTDESASIARP